MVKSLLLRSLVLSTALAGIATAQTATPTTKPQIGSYGFDTSGMDRSVKPGDDFYKFADGAWQARTTIPADRPSQGAFYELYDLSQARTRTILDEATKTSGSKIGDFYASFLDEAAVDAKGTTPVGPWIAEVQAIADKRGFVAEMGKLQQIGVRGLFDVGIGQDDKQPDQYIASMGQGGLGLPDRDYYLKDDAKLATIRTAYQAYLARMLGFAGVPAAEASARATAIFGLEKAIAQVHWTRIQSRDADAVYNKWSAADFPAKAPGIDWAAYQGALGVTGQRNFIVAQPSAVTGEAKLVADAPLPVLKDLLTVRLLRAYASYLPKNIDQTNFGFYGTTLSGVPEQQTRWKRGVDLVSDMMGEEVGKVYVARYFPPEAKAAADQLVRNIIAAMGERLDKLEWMAPETKVKARAKLAAFTPKIGYPSRWRDYATLEVGRGDLVGNVARARAFEYRRNLHKLGQPIDRTEWQMTPMEINAYANPTMNEIVFPAAILQPPFFDPHADPAVNYGGIGAVIGHEMSHHFDDQGRKYDLTGKLTDWWTPQDVTRFKAFTDALVKQYDQYEPIPGQHVQGGLTLGENIADLAGLTVSIDAYHRSLGGKPAPVIDGMTGDQRFYLGYAQVWREKNREEALRMQLLSDPHSPGALRAETVRNLDPWYAAFGAKPGDKLYLAPKDRVRIW
jgi:putative endopeptidase